MHALKIVAIESSTLPGEDIAAQLGSLAKLQLQIIGAVK